MAEMMRIPTVMVITQRGGPSTATVIYSQQETTLTCFGGNGEGIRIVYSTSSHQELFDYTIKAFNTAWKYRFPTFVLGDGYQSKMRESLTIYDPETRNIEFVPPEPYIGKAGVAGIDRDPEHLRNTYNMEDELYEVIRELVDAFNQIAPEIIEYNEVETEDAEVLVVAHGVVSRAAEGAVKKLRKEGARAGSFRPITLRPFPEKQLRACADRAQKILVVESAEGQLKRMVTDAIYGCTTPITNLFRPGESITVEEIISAAKDLL